MANTHTMLQSYLEDSGCFDTTMHTAFERMLATISQEAPYKMKLMMTVTELVIFTSHLRKPIQLLDGTIVPINIMSFVLAASGRSKDSSVAMLRRTLAPAYEVIDKYREDNAKTKAMHDARLNGDEPEEWQKYYQKPRELMPGLGSIEGQMNHWALLEQGKLGAAVINVSELGSELQTNKDIIGNIEALSKGYDLGRIPSKIVKSAENQVAPIKSLPINCLMFGAEEAILYNDPIKRKFKEEFVSKLSRRTYFNYDNEPDTLREFSSLDELDEYKRKLITDANSAREALEPIFVELVKSTTHEPLKVSPEADKLFNRYLEYNAHVSSSMPKLYPICALARRHMQWKSLKLAGAIAILESSSTIEFHHLLYAIRFSELFSNDLAEFEAELVKEPYELFCAFMRAKAEHGKSTASLHVLRKMGYLPASSGSSQAKLKELVQLATSYDKRGMYTICDDGVCFEDIVPTAITGVSTLPVSGSKSTRTKQCAGEFTYSETTFEALGNMLKQDYAYSPFQFLHNRRGRDNVIPITKWMALDIDTSTVTASELHFILQDINHHIALTSDPTNDFKFRLLVEFNAPVELNTLEWKYFTESISEHLCIQADILPQSQIFFAYAGREVLSVLDAHPIDVKDHVLFARAEAKSKSKPEKPLTKAEQQALVNDPLTTFNYCFECPMDESGSRAMIKMAHHARKLGMTKDDIIALVHKANDYWSPYSMPDSRLENTIISQIRRW